MSLKLKAALLALGICAGAMSSNVGNDHINDSNMFVRTIYNELSKPRIEVAQVQTALAERPYFASDGRIIYKNNELYGYLDYSGNVVIPAQYSHAQGFSGGLAKVYRDGVQSIIDTEGNEVFNEKNILKQMNEHYEYVDIQDFHEGLAVAGYDDTWGYIDVRGQFVIEPGLYFGLSEFSEGLAEVVKIDGSRVFIDRNGNVVFSCHENFAYDPFQEGLSTTYSFDNGKMGYVNRIGELVIPIEFEHAGKFNDGYAVASKNTFTVLLIKMEIS